MTVKSRRTSRLQHPSMAPKNRASDLQVLANQVAATLVHRLFPEFRSPAYLACPDDRSSEMCCILTARLRDIFYRPNDNGHSRPTLLILDGFDLLEGDKNDAPTFPFRSKFQFDQEHLWLFMGRDWPRLRNIFGDRRLPLYRAASDVTPETWRVN